MNLKDELKKVEKLNLRGKEYDVAQVIANLRKAGENENKIKKIVEEEKLITLLINKGFKQENFTTLRYYFNKNKYIVVYQDVDDNVWKARLIENKFDKENYEFTTTRKDLKSIEEALEVIKEA